MERPLTSELVGILSDAVEWKISDRGEVIAVVHRSFRSMV